MGFELRFAHGADDLISEFVLDLPDEVQESTLEQIEADLYHLAADPMIAGPPWGEDGPTFHFSVLVGWRVHDLEVRFRYTEDERAVEITGFRHW